ncbi:Intersectin 1 (SH3 domain protein) [Geranomyces variabilis]|nr:Intersectin 1 (SH3 domain protein) [Geranomyces variabilis]
MDIDAALDVKTSSDLSQHQQQAAGRSSDAGGGASSPGGATSISAKLKGTSSRWRPTSGHFAIKTGGGGGHRYSNSFDNLASPNAVPREFGGGSGGAFGLRRVQSVKEHFATEHAADNGGGGGGHHHHHHDRAQSGENMSSVTSPDDFSTLAAQHLSMEKLAKSSAGGSSTLFPEINGGSSGGGGGGGGASHPAVVRSRSSYSFQAMNSVLTVPNLMRNLRKPSVVPATIAATAAAAAAAATAGTVAAPQQPATIPHNALSPASANAEDASPSGTLPGKKDKFLYDIGAQAFAGMWNHPITRCYFLMFLLWKEYENLYYFRLDAQQFRLDYPTLYSSARKSQAYRLYNAYLVKTSPMYILRRVPPNYQNALTIIATLKANIDTHDATLFDDLSYVVLNWLVDIFNGTFESRLDASEAGGKTTTTTAAPKSPVEDPSTSFAASAMYQAMRNDLRGTRHLTTIQYNRVAERITDMPPVVYGGEEVWDKLMVSLECMGLDCEPFRARGYGSALVRRPSQKLQESRASSRTRSFSNLNETRKSSTGAETPEDPGTPNMREWRKSSSHQMNAYVKNDLSHTFVQYMNADQAFCEYCFKLLRTGNEGPISTYRCESCGYMCHKHCRKEIHVSCIQPSTTLDSEDQTEVLSDKTQRITEKMQAIQREVDIEMKIRDGLHNLARAKSELSTKSKKTAPLEVDSQMERSTKKLEVLKHELQKCRLQLAALSAAAAATASAAMRNSEVSPASANNNANNGASGGGGGGGGGAPPGLGNHQRMSSTASLIMQDIDREGEVVKVVSMDAALKAESTKTFYVTNQTTVRQLIGMALEKFVLPGLGEDYCLAYTSADGEEVPLRQEDFPYRLGLNLIDTHFRLKLSFDGKLDKLSASPSKMSKEDEIRQRKQREVLMEISETEINYTEDLRNLVSVFNRPLAAAGVLNTEDETKIFSNLKDILDIHSSISDALVGKRERIMQEDCLGDIVALFANNVTRLHAYETYCGNQHNARRVLERRRTDLAFAKQLAQCEANPKLQKLGLPDLLVKPMHRVTRYPILFKRLLSYVPKGQVEHEAVNTLITDIESRVADINESVRRREAEYRINVIDDNLDFNGVTERFKLANGRRELISEKTFTYLKKNTNGTVEVSVVFFTDLVLIIRPRKTADSFILFKPPIPLEAAVFLDKPDAFGLKNVFLIIHLQQEIHSLQAISAYDKNNWLLESEAIRSQFCSLHYQYEHKILKDSTAKYQRAEAAAHQQLANVGGGGGGSFHESDAPSVGSHSNSPAPRRANTSSAYSSLRREKPISSSEAGQDSSLPPGSDASSTKNGSVSSRGDIKRTGSWASMFKSQQSAFGGGVGVGGGGGGGGGTIRSKPTIARSSNMLAENNLVDTLPALPTRTMSENTSVASLKGSTDGIPSLSSGGGGSTLYKSGGAGSVRRGSSVSFHSNVPSSSSPSQHKSKASLSSKGSRGSIDETGRGERGGKGSKKEHKKGRKKKKPLSSIIFDPTNNAAAGAGAEDTASTLSTADLPTPLPSNSSFFSHRDGAVSPAVGSVVVETPGAAVPPGRAATLPETTPPHRRENNKQRTSWAGSAKHWWTWSKAKGPLSTAESDT